MAGGGIRQTVYAGPVDSNGFASFGGSTGSTTVTASGTLKVTAAGGQDPADDRKGSITNPSFTGLSTDGTMYLYLDVAADGTCTSGSTTLAPVYQFGGTYSVTSGQFTFNISEMTAKIGNGSAAVQAYRMFVGEVTVASSVVSAITWYALNGKCYSAWETCPGSTGLNISTNHLLGIIPATVSYEVECVTAENGYVAGDRVTITNVWNGTTIYQFGAKKTRLYSHLPPITSFIFFLWNQSTSGGFNVTTNWKYRLVANRGW